MQPEFDPYYRWLGIRDTQRPPNHYRLLGLEPFETDSEVISAAADRQMAHIRNYAHGPHALVSQHMLNEIAAARLCLLNPQRREQYDRDLRLRTGAIPQAPVGPATYPGGPGSSPAYGGPGASPAAPAYPQPGVGGDPFPAPLTPQAAAGGTMPGPVPEMPLVPQAPASMQGVPASPASFGAGARPSASWGGSVSAPSEPLLQVEDGVRRVTTAPAAARWKRHLQVAWGIGLFGLILALLLNRTQVASWPSAPEAPPPREIARVEAPSQGTPSPGTTGKGVDGSTAEAAVPPAKLVEAAPWKAHDGSIRQAAISLDGKMLLTVGIDQLGQVRHLPDGKVFRELKGHLTMLQTAAITRDASRYATGAIDGSLLLWKPDESAPAVSLSVGEVSLRGLAFSRTGNLIAGADDAGTLHVWEAATGTPVGTFNVQPVRFNGATFLDEERLLLCGEDPVVRLVKAADGSPLREYRGHKSGVNAVAYPGEGKRFLTAGSDGQICWWDSETRTPLRKIQASDKALHAAALSPDGKLGACGGDDNLVRVYDLLRGRELARSGKLPGYVRSLVWSPDAATLYVCGTEPNIRRFAAPPTPPPDPPKP